MMDVRLTLEFDCCHCAHPVQVIVQCRGPMQRTDPTRIRLGVTVPCPECQRISQIAFDPTGMVHDAEPVVASRRSLVPSLN